MLSRLSSPGIRLLLCGVFAQLTSCAEDPDASVVEPVAAAVAEASPVAEAAAEAASEEEINTAIAAVDDEAEAATPGSSSQPSTVGDEISHALSQKMPLEINDDVERWLDFFTAKDRSRFQRFLERGERYKGPIMALLREQGVPTEIYYQAMIESGFATGATSRAHAVGVWQFMKETGRRYGLRVDSYVDERRDPMRSTIAAALYMKDLYNVFQSWYLAIAAYNAGEGRIMNTIMRAKTRDFWTMVKMKVLPNETLNYIPKFLAATLIGHNPKQYGFEELAGEAPVQLVSVAVPSPVRLADIASLTGMTASVLAEYNPHLLRGITPPGVNTYRIWVPMEEAAGIESLNERLSALRIRGLRSLSSREAATQHTVVQGESLAKIAALHGLSVRQLKHLNHLRAGRVTPGTILALTAAGPNRGGAVVQGNAAGPEQARYRVRSGDSLNSIARRFGVSISELKRLNGLKRNSIAAGQVLRLREQKG